MEIKRNILLNPGPATTTDTVKYAQVVPDICPREKEFGLLIESVCRDIVKIARGDEENYVCILFGGSGTAGMDAVINSVTPPGKKILIINNGAYGKRMVEIAKAYSIAPVELTCDQATLPKVEDVESALRNDPEIACIAMVHHETTTGLLNPVREIGEIAKQYDKVFIVDAISSFAGIPADIKEHNIDFMMSTSNKCIQGMAGVCFVICSRHELEKLKDYPKRSFYLDLHSQYDFFLKTGQMQFTPPVQTIYALRRAIDEFLQEGAENRYERYRKSWETLRNGITEMGFRILTNPAEESNLLITILYPEDPDFDFETVHDRLFEKGFTIYPGKVGKLKSFRLAVLGAVDHHDINNFLCELKNILKETRVKGLIIVNCEL